MTVARQDECLDLTGPEIARFVWAGDEDISNRSAVERLTGSSIT